MVDGDGRRKVEIAIKMRLIPDLPSLAAARPGGRVGEGFERQAGHRQGTGRAQAGPRQG